MALSKCQCHHQKHHLGIFPIIPTFEIPTKIKKNQKILQQFFFGNGIEINNNIQEAKKLLLERDHQDTAALTNGYVHGKLGVKIVPPFCLSKNQSEREMFDGLKSFYNENGDDVVILHSHMLMGGYKARKTRKNANSRLRYLLSSNVNLATSNLRILSI